MDRTPDLSMDDSHASVESPKSSASYVASLAGRSSSRRSRFDSNGSPRLTSSARSIDRLDSDRLDSKNRRRSVSLSGKFIKSKSNVQHLGQIWSGESQYGFGSVLAFKALCVLLVPRLSHAWALCLAFFGIGAAMAVLDTFNIMLVGRLLKARSGAELAKYDLCYGLGGMVAPYIAILVHKHSWDVLATVDLILAAVVVRRRACIGKPTDWKQKIRNPENAGQAASIDEVLQPVPQKVLRAGLTFAFISQIGSTSISAWGFAFTTKRFNFPEEWAALVPSSFYLASMLPRFANTYLARRILASTLVHVSLIFIALGSLSVLTASVLLTGDFDQSHGYLLMFVGIWLMGTGYANHYSRFLVSMTQHGELSSHQSGMFGSSICFGITVGLWLAGLMDLAYVEVGIAMLLTAIWTAHIREFPFCGTVKQKAVLREPP